MTKSDYQEYLERKHAQFTTSPEAINRVVKEITGLESSGRRKIVAGEINEVYEVAVPGKEVIVRISRSDEPRFEAERWAIEQCLKVGVPAPKVIGIKDIETDGQRLSFCLEEKLPGKPLSDLLDEYSDDSEFVKAICRQIGGITSRIHQVKTTGFGRINSLGQGKYSALEEYLLHREDQRVELLDSAKYAGLDPQVIDKALKFIRDSIPQIKDVKVRLLHQDVSPRHFLVENGQVTGVIDFENAESGDPVADFAWWNFFEGVKLPVKLLIEGYQDLDLINNNFELRLKVYRLNLGLGLLKYYVGERNPAGLRYVVENLDEDTSC